MSDIEETAGYFGLAPEILPFLPRLLADIPVLGSWPEEIIEMLRPLELTPHLTEVLDLGCGKGAVSLSIAREMRLKVRGVDLFQPFIEEAARRAKSLRVADLSKFEVGDMREVMKEEGSYEVVVFAAVGGVLGDFSRTVRHLRTVCRHGGYMVIDDGFLAHCSILNRPGYEHYRSHDETVRQLTSHGDTLVQEVIIPLEKLTAYNRKNTESIEKRADELSMKYPSMEASFDRYVQWEKAECEIIEKETVPAIWLLRRN